MKNFKINTGLISTIILSFYILRFLCSNFMEDVFLIYLIPTFWVTLFIYLKLNNPFENRLNIKKTMESHISIMVIIALFIVLNFSLGLFLSYSKNPYSSKAVLYLWEYVVFVFFQEYVRFLLVANNKDDLPKVVSLIILFTLIELQPSYFINSFQSQKTIEYVVCILVPIILESILFAYFVKMYDRGYILSTVYRTCMGLYTYAAPVYPNLREDSALLLRIMLIMIIFFKTAIIDRKTNFLQIDNTKSKIKREQKTIKQNNQVFYATVFSLSLITVVFISGITGYFPIAINSGSMHDSIEIGDVVIVEKLDGEKVASTPKVGDVLVYKLDSVLVVHRIVKTGRSPVTNEVYYVTKGDNNVNPDKLKVSLNQVIGITRYKIPYLGYPSILTRKILAKIS